jgi:hypothetical protein
MELREEILAENSRKQGLKVAGWIGNDKKRFSRFLDIFLYDDYRTTQLAAHILSFIADKHPELIEDNFRPIFNRMFDEGVHTAVKRNVLRILQFVNIPEDLHAKVVNVCMDYMADPNETVAVRCFSMTILSRLTEQYPDLKSELSAVIKTRMKDVSGGLKVRAREVLKQLTIPEQR